MIQNFTCKIQNRLPVLSSPNFSSESSSIIRRIMSKAFRTSFFLMVFKLLCCCSISRDTFKGKVSESTIPWIFPMYTSVTWGSLESKHISHLNLYTMMRSSLICGLPPTHRTRYLTYVARYPERSELQMYRAVKFNLDNYLHNQNLRDYIRHQMACL